MFEFDEVQLAKLSELRESGVNPYPSGEGLNSKLAQNIKYYRDLSIQTLEEERIQTIAARIRFKNEMGSMGFGRVDFEGESVQISVKKNDVSPESYAAWKKLDIGDWILVSGSLTRTRTGELTLNAKTLSLYSKCIQGMPDKVVGITDVETRHRMRYLDLIVNQDSRKTFQKRFEIIKFIRYYLDSNDFVEVETPILQSIPGGATAKPFQTHHNALDIDLYMRIAPELYLKRLIVGGFDKVFEIGKNFRNEGISQKHNPEFTMVEFYQAHANYKNLITFIRSLIVEMVFSIHGDLNVKYDGKLVDFSVWNEISFEESLRQPGISDPWSEDSIRLFIQGKGFYVEPKLTLSDLQQKAFDLFVEPNLINPTFITMYPAELSPLARKNDLDPRVTDRFELFINGFEIANGFSELNDPVDQAERFNQQVARKNGGDDEAMYFDQDYIKALSYGMPPTAGAGIGIDRLVMLLTNKTSIRDVILFPTRKVKDE
jgi:lysyl-tRNA synthetase, class II